MWVGDIQSLGGLSWTKRQKKVRLLSACAETSIFSYPGHRPSWFSGFWTEPGVYTTGPWFSGLHTRAEFYHQLSWFSSFQTAHHRTSQPPYPITIQSIAIINVYLYLYIYISICIYLWRYRYIDIFCWFCFSGKSWLKHTLIPYYDFLVVKDICLSLVTAPPCMGPGAEVAFISYLFHEWLCTHQEAIPAVRTVPASSKYSLISGITSAPDEQLLLPRGELVPSLQQPWEMGGSMIMLHRQGNWGTS